MFYCHKRLLNSARIDYYQMKKVLVK